MVQGDRVSDYRVLEKRSYALYMWELMTWGLALVG